MTSPTSLGMGAVLTVAIAVWAMLSFNEYLPGGERRWSAWPCAC